MRALRSHPKGPPLSRRWKRAFFFRSSNPRQLYKAVYFSSARTTESCGTVSALAPEMGVAFYPRSRYGGVTPNTRGALRSSQEAAFKRERLCFDTDTCFSLRDRSSVNASQLPCPCLRGRSTQRERPFLSRAPLQHNPSGRGTMFNGAGG